MEKTKSKDELMMELGRLEESSQELEDVSEDCNEAQEEAVGIFATILKILERVFLVTK